MKKLLRIAFRILIEITILVASAITLYVLFTGGGVIVIGPIIFSSRRLARPVIILLIALVLRRLGTGHFLRGMYSVAFLRWSWRQICRLTERWVASARFRRQSLYGLLALILVSVGAGWAQYAALLERGLMGRYYHNPNFEGEPDVVALDDGPHLRRARTLWNEFYSVEWTGSLYIAIPGKYEFSTASDDGSALYIGEQLIVDNLGRHGLIDRNGFIRLKRGFVPLRIRYHQATKASALRVYWRGRNHKEREFFPQTVLFPEQPTFGAFFLERATAAAWSVLQFCWILLLVLIVITGVVHRHIVGPVVAASVVGTIWRWLNRVFGAKFLARIVDLISGKNPWISRKRDSWILHFTILLLFSLLIIYNHLGARSMESADENIHTRVANTIVKTGNWWNLEYRGQPYTQKPPLKIWLSALTFKYIGNTEFWVRFWDATFALGTMCIVYVLGRKWMNPLTGLMGAVILCLSWNYIYGHCARTGVQDSAMIFFFSLAVLLFWFRELGKRYYYLAGLAMACSSLTKTWMGVGSLVIMIGYLILADDFKEIRRKEFMLMAAISILLPLAWLVPNLLAVPGFYRSAIAENIIGRITGSRHSDFAGEPWYAHAVTLYHYYQPWVMVLPIALVYGMYRGFAKKDRGALLLVVWSVVVFGGFSVAKLRLSWYINPVFPAFALVIAGFFYAIFRWGRRTFQTRAPFVLTCMLLGLGYLFLHTTILLYQRSTATRRTHPIQDVVVYLEKTMRDTPYHVVLYQTNMDKDVGDQEHYYLNRIRERVTHSDSREQLQEFLAHTTAPTFVLIRDTDIESSAFFTDHEQLLPLFIPDSPENKWIATYNYDLPPDFPLSREQKEKEESLET